MSDFDKEAEREKLREKYERDQAEREATQRMSDLLLKGATMTNSHCGTCGDPLFQQDGTTFCPGCHGNPDAVSGTELESQSAEDTGDEGPPADSRATDAGAQTSAPDRSARDGDEATETASNRAPTAPDAGGETPEPDRSASSDRRTNEQSAPSSTDPDATPATPERASRSPARSTNHRRQQPAPADGDDEAVRRSLQQALEKFAAEAAATDDPRYARECLEAAREASETLNTLR